MTNEMRPYGDHNGTSGITGYAIGEYEDGNGWMEIEYRNGGIYRYNECNVGAINFAVMKALAIVGSGLNSYINEHVRGRGVRCYNQPSYSRTFTVTPTNPRDVEILSEVLTAIGVEFSVS